MARNKVTTELSELPVYRLIDAALFSRALCAAVIRWEPFPSGNGGEICIGGCRHAVDLEHGFPLLNNLIRAELETRLEKVR
jgi:hypothetical protein